MERRRQGASGRTLRRAAMALGLILGFARMAAAQAGGPPPDAGRALLGQVFLIASMVVIFYFLILRPQQKAQRETRKMLSALKAGDRVLTTGGIFGTVKDVKEDLVVIALTRDDAVKVEVAKSAVTTVVQPKK